MKVNIAVCGKFHFGSYIRIAAERGLLNRFYFSHKLGASHELALPDPTMAVNLPAAAYLTHGFQRFFGDKLAPQIQPLFGSIWARQVAARWISADIFHFVAHGHATKLVKRAKSENATVIAEAVNTHPRHQREIIAREADRWGVRATEVKSDPREARILDEIEAADYVLVPTRTVGRSYVERGVDQKKIIKIPYAANLDRFYPSSHHRTSPNGQPLRIICVGSICLRKGQLNLLEACRRLGKSVVSLTLVGFISDDIAPLVSKYASEFTHILHVPNERLRDVLLDHDVFVLPSLEEGLSISVCEALACGLPVLATRESGGEELIADGETGFFVEPASVDQLMDRLLYLSRNRELAFLAGRQAAERTSAEVNWKNYVDDLASAYRRVLDERRAKT